MIDKVTFEWLGLKENNKLYRVTSFIGLAAVLIVVSFLYQRFMTGQDGEEKQGMKGKIEDAIS